VSNFEGQKHAKAQESTGNHAKAPLDTQPAKASNPKTKKPTEKQKNTLLGSTIS